MADDTTDDGTELITTDEAILDSIGEGQDATTDKQSSAESQASDTTRTTQATDSGKGAGKGDEDKSKTEKTGGPQDLVDRDGNVVATGGKERRFYETAQREKSRADGLEKQITSLQGQLDAINKAGTVGTQYNLSPEEVTTGAQLIAAYKQNPVETIQYMLTQAQASGHNIEAISSGGANMDAVKQMMETALQPLIAEQKTRADTQAVDDRALEIYNEFSAKHPDAAVHEPSLARLLKDDPTLSPEAAYFKLRSYYSERGLDWTKSLVQLQQNKDATNTGEKNTQQALPEGGTNPANVTDKAQVADVSTSTGDIVKDAMREAGIDI